MPERIDKQYLEFAKHLEQSKGLNAEWPIAVQECVKHLRREAEFYDDEPHYSVYTVTKQDVENIERIRNTKVKGH